MCGIFGVISNDSLELKNNKLLEFERIQHHRGPDDSGIYRDQFAFLGFNRLSIIDLSEMGHQPMTDSSGRYWIIFNGEIYNFLKLRSSLTQKYHFKSRTDTEVVLYSFIESGEKCLRDLDGMFAFAIWDNINKSLFLARDRFGEKPLWYYQTAEGIVFSSEIRTMLQTNTVPRQLDSSGVYHYPWMGASYGHSSVINNVKQVNPGHYLEFKIGSRNEQKVYWDLRSTERIDRDISFENARDNVKKLVVDSIEQRLVSDVPLGLFYSGGIDSSVIAAVTSNILGKRMQSYSIGFAEQEYDESEVAHFGSKYYSLEHHALLISRQDFVRDFPKFISLMDSPISDGINSFYVSKFARQNLTVALSGIGADEIFGGYSTFRYLNLLKTISPLQIPFFKVGKSLFDSLPISIQTLWTPRSIAYLLGAFKNLGLQHELVRTFFRGDELDSIFSRDYLEEGIKNGQENPKILLDTMCSITGMNSNNLCSQISLREIHSYMSYLLLPAIDMFSMAFSLEVRSPFLSHKLFEYVYSLPDNIKWIQGKQKPLLVSAFKEYLPPEITDRKKKGFGFPLEAWALHNDFKNIFTDVLTSQKFKQRNIFNSFYIEKHLLPCLSSTDKSKLPHQVFMKLWSLLIFELWLREHFDA